MATQTIGNRLFTQWRYTTTENTREVIMPDGCQDVLIVTDPDARATVLITDRDNSARAVAIESGKTYTGFRLRPGLTFKTKDIEHLKADNKAVQDFIKSEAEPQLELCQLIATLSEEKVSIRQLAKLAGVSLRTLQRHFKQRGLPHPDYWWQLARARSAALALSSAESLTDIAISSGYSDQSHLTRDCRRWFLATPAQLRANKQQLLTFSQPGLGNWTGEHISIRKPFGSET